jgi:hypothetical protein
MSFKCFLSYLQIIFFYRKLIVERAAQSHITDGLDFVSIYQTIQYVHVMYTIYIKISLHPAISEQIIHKKCFIVLVRQITFSRNFTNNVWLIWYLGRPNSADVMKVSSRDPCADGYTPGRDWVFYCLKF